MSKPPRSTAPIDYMTPREVCNTARIVSRTLRRWIKNKGFPQPVRLGPRIVRFHRHEVMAFLSKGVRRAQ
jgi:excisionase family DNA binding protein